MGCLVPERSRGSGRLLWKPGDDGEVTTSCTNVSLMTTSGGLTGTKVGEVAINRAKEVDAVGEDETPAILFDAVFVFFFFFLRLSDAVSDGG